MNNASELAKYSKSIQDNVGVHDLLCPSLELSSVELKVLDFLFETAPRPEMNDIYMKQNLFVHDYVTLSRECLLTAGPNALMDGMIIDAVGLMFTQKQRKKDGVLRSWYLPTWVKTKIDTGEHFGNIWNTLSFYIDNSLIGCDKIYIPINEDNKHWYLVVFSAPNKAIYYVDTCKDNFSRRWSVCTKMVEFVEFLVNIMRDQNEKDAKKLGRWKSMDEWFRVELINLPDQAALNDRVNCGAYVIHFMLHPKEVPDVTDRTVITAKNRMRLMASLILWEENSVRRKILEYLQIEAIYM